MDYQYYQNSRNLSLNVSSLSVASPLSPVGPHGQGSPFSFEPPSASTSPVNSTRHFDEHPHLRGTPHSSRPPSAGIGNPSASPTVSSSSQLPRKRSFTAHPNMSAASPICSGAPSTTHSVSSSPSTISVIPGLGLSSVVNVTPLVEVDAEHEADDGYDDDSLDMADPSSTVGGSGSDRTSPVEATSNGVEDATSASHSTIGGGMGATMGVIGKPMATNNFVTKLYQ